MTDRLTEEISGVENSVDEPNSDGAYDAYAFNGVNSVAEYEKRHDSHMEPKAKTNIMRSFWRFGRLICHSIGTGHK